MKDIPIEVIFIIIIGTISLFLFWSADKVKKKRVRYQNLGRNAFESIKIGDTFEDVSIRFFDENITRSLVSEKLIDNYIVRKVYIWEFPLDYKVAQSSGGSTSFVHNFGNTNNGNSVGYTAINRIYTLKAYIKVTFDNDRVIAKEQKGI